MRIQNKVFVIVYRIGKKGLEFLCLKPNPEPGRNTDYYVVTGSVEKNETSESAALREVEEEIGVASKNIINLHDEIRYLDKITGQENVEYCYAVRIGEEIIKLNEEHIGHKWVNSDNFINTIWWDEDKAKLKKMIKVIYDKKPQLQ